MKMKKPDAGRFGMLGSLAAFLDGFDGFVAFAFGTFANFSGFSFTSPFRFFPTLLCITKRRRSVRCFVILPFLAIRNPSLVAKNASYLTRKSAQVISAEKDHAHSNYRCSKDSLFVALLGLHNFGRNFHLGC